MKKRCIVPSCTSFAIDGRQYCYTHRHKSAVLYNNKARSQGAKDVYKSKEWAKARADKIRKSPYCEECIKKGIYTGGSIGVDVWSKKESKRIKKYYNNKKEPIGLEVHHIIPLDEDISLAYDTNNLMVLCKSCHAKIEAEAKKNK